MARECSTRSSALSSNGLFDRHRYAQILPLHCFKPGLPRRFMTYNTTLFAAARRQYLVEHQKH